MDLFESTAVCVYSPHEEARGHSVRPEAVWARFEIWPMGLFVRKADDPGQFRGHWGSFVRARTASEPSGHRDLHPGDVSTGSEPGSGQ